MDAPIITHKYNLLIKTIIDYKNILLEQVLLKILMTIYQ